MHPLLFAVIFIDWVVEFIYICINSKESWTFASLSVISEMLQYNLLPFIPKVFWKWKVPMNAIFFFKIMIYITVNFDSLDLCLPTLLLALMAFEQSFVNLCQLVTHADCPSSSSSTVQLLFCTVSFKTRQKKDVRISSWTSWLRLKVMYLSCIILIALDRSNFTEISGADDCRATRRLLRSKAGI